MRKIERNMNRAIADRRDWSRDNTRVELTDAGTGRERVRVFLHDNLIAVVTRSQVQFTLAGWPTPTTRSRLNAIIGEFTTCDGVYQRKGEQYLTSGFKSLPDTYLESTSWYVLPRWGFGHGGAHVRKQEVEDAA